MQSFRFQAFLGSLAAFNVGLIAPALAQEGAAALEEIIVTATKREEDLQKTPISLTAISGEDIGALGKTTAEDVLIGVPGVEVQGTARGFAASIRGIADDLPTGFGEASVAYNLDGVYTARPEMGKLGFFDVNRVEVLRGPQGTLYGRNATAGAVNIIANEPVDHYDASGTLEVGNLNLLRFEGMVNLPVNNTTAVRAAFSSINRNGYLSNGQDDQVAQGGRVRISYKPNEDFSLLTGGDFTKLGGKSNGSVPVFISEPADPYYTPNTPDVYDRASVWKVFARTDWNLGVGVATFIPAFQRMTDTNFYTFTGPPQLTRGHDPKKFDQLSGEFRLASQAEARIKWVGGLFYYDSDTFTDGYNPTSTLPNQAYSYQSRQTKSSAAFGELTVPLADRLRVTAGARYTADDKVVEQQDTSTAGVISVTHIDADWTHFDYKANVEFDLAAQSLLYAQVSTGYRPGGGNTGNVFGPEELTAYEIGSKNRFMNDRLQLNGSAFYYDYTDYQAIDAVFLSTGLQLNITNSPGATVFGGELEAIYLVTDHDRVNLSASYLSAKYEDLVLAGVDYDGFTLPHSPKWGLNAGYEHRWDLGDSGSLTAGVNAHYQTKSYVNVSQTLESLQPAYWKGNLTAGYRSSDDKWGVNAWMKNVNDEVVKTGRYGSRNTLAPPRTYGINLTVRM